jgi:hypothetical protein
MQCSAKSKRTTHQCRANAMLGKTKCYHHGGMSRVGEASATYANGKYSKYLPTRLAARYQAAERDPKLLSLASELALLDARLADVLSRVDRCESGTHWEALQQAYSGFLQARRSGSEAAIDAAIEALDRPIKGALEDYRAWGHIYTLIEQRRKLAETEHKRLVTSQQMINSTEAMVLVARLTDITSKAVLGIAKRLSGDALAVAPAVEQASKQALSHIIVKLQQVLTRDEERPTFARPGPDKP